MGMRDMMRRRGGEEGTALSRKESDPFMELHREMDRLFERLSRGIGFGWLRERDLGVFTPSIDVQETESEVRVVAELPGMDRNDVEIWLESDHLMLSGEKKMDEEHKEGSYYSQERYHGSFTRMIPLPCQVEFEKVEAQFKNGILTISMPKSEQARKMHRKIEIKGE